MSVLPKWSVESMQLNQNPKEDFIFLVEMYKLNLKFIKDLESQDDLKNRIGGLVHYQISTFMKL